MVSVAVCDDNLQFLKLLTSSLRNICAHQLPERIGCDTILQFNSCDDVLSYLENHVINILFLDINMPSKSGFDLAEVLRARYPDIIIIFVSSYDTFVYSSFVYSPFRFLRKSHLEAELPEAFLRAVDTYLNRGRTLSLSTVDGDVTLRVDDILSIESERNYYLVHCADITYRCRGTLTEAEELTKDFDFCRIHAAYIINLANIEKILSASSVQIKGGMVIPVSQRRAGAFREAYMKYTRKGSL